MADLFTRSFVALLLAQASFGFAFSSFFLLPKYVATELAGGPAAIGAVTAAFYVTAVLLQPTMGILVDRSGRRGFMTAGALLMAVASLGFVWIDALGPAIFVLRVLQGAAFAMAFVAGSTLAVDEAPPGRLALALGIFGLTMLSMNAVAPVVVETLADRAGWKPAFAMSAAASLVSCLLSRRVRDTRQPAHNEVAPGFWAVARHPRMRAISAVVALVGAAFGAAFTFHQPFALELGIHELRSFFVAYTIAAVAARLAVGPFAERLGYGRLTAIALVAYTASVAGLAELGRLGLVPVGAAFGVAHGIFYPTFNALAVTGVGPRERGKVMALFNGAFNVGVAAGQFGLGLLAEARGYPPVFVVAGLCALGALLVLARVPPLPAGGAFSPSRDEAGPPAGAAPRCGGP